MHKIGQRHQQACHSWTKELSKLNSVIQSPSPKGKEWRVALFDFLHFGRRLQHRLSKIVKERLLEKLVEGYYLRGSFDLSLCTSHLMLFSVRNTSLIID